MSAQGGMAPTLALPVSTTGRNGPHPSPSPVSTQGRNSLPLWPVCGHGKGRGWGPLSLRQSGPHIVHVPGGASRYHPRHVHVINEDRVRILFASSQCPIWCQRCAARTTGPPAISATARPQQCCCPPLRWSVSKGFQSPSRYSMAKSSPSVLVVRQALTTRIRLPFQGS